MAGERGSLTEGSVRGHLMRMALPMCVAITAMMTTGLVDSYWVGRIGTEELAAVSFCGPVMMAVMSVAIGLGAGVASVISRAAGVGDREQLRRLSTNAAVLMLLVMAVISLLGFVSVRPLFAALGAEDGFLDAAVIYMRIWFAGATVMMGLMLASNVLRAMGQAIAPSVVMISSSVVNLILDPLLIFGVGPFPEMGIAGAALATVLSNVWACAAGLWLLIARERLIAFSLPTWSALIESWRGVAAVGGPAALSNSVNPIANVTIMSAFAVFGAGIVGGVGVGMRVEALAIIPFFALSASIGPIAGQNFGAGRLDRVRETFTESYRMIVLWGVGAAAFLAILREPIAGLFPPDADVQVSAAFYLLIMPLTTIGYGIGIVTSAGFNALGRPMPGLIMNVGRALGLYAPAAWVGAHLAGWSGALLGMALANIVAGVLSVAWTLTVGAPRAAAPAIAE